MNSITVFCAASLGNDVVFGQQAYALGKYLASHHIQLVYGGAQVGLMGKVADGCLDSGGYAIGIIPTFLETKEITHPGLSELIVVNSMHERKTLMHDKCEGIIALPGGFGTLEELFEVLTWAQLGLHQKPIGLLNCNGFYNDLILFIQKMVDKGVLKPAYQHLFVYDHNIEQLIEKMKVYQAPQLEKWIKSEEQV